MSSRNSGASFSRGNFGVFTGRVVVSLIAGVDLVLANRALPGEMTLLQSFGESWKEPSLGSLPWVAAVVVALLRCTVEGTWPPILALLVTLMFGRSVVVKKSVLSMRP